MSHFFKRARKDQRASRLLIGQRQNNQTSPQDAAAPPDGRPSFSGDSSESPSPAELSASPPHSPPPAVTVHDLAPPFPAPPPPGVVEEPPASTASSLPPSTDCRSSRGWVSRTPSQKTLVPPPSSEPASQPASQPVSEPAFEPVSQPTPESVSEPASDPALEPRPSQEVLQSNPTPPHQGSGSPPSPISSSSEAVTAPQTVDSPADLPAGPLLPTDVPSKSQRDTRSSAAPSSGVSSEKPHHKVDPPVRPQSEHLARASASALRVKVGDDHGVSAQMEFLASQIHAFPTSPDQVVAEIQALQKSLLEETAALINKKYELLCELDEIQASPELHPTSASEQLAERATYSSSNVYQTLVELRRASRMKDITINQLHAKVSSLELSLIQSKSRLASNAAQHATPKASSTFDRRRTAISDEIEASMLRSSGEDHAAIFDNGQVTFEMDVEYARFQTKRLALPLKASVDQIKRLIFSELLPAKDPNDYVLGLSALERLDVEFLRFIRSHESFLDHLMADTPIRIGVFPRAVAGSKMLEKSRAELYSEIAAWSHTVLSNTSLLPTIVTPSQGDPALLFCNPNSTVSSLCANLSSFVRDKPIFCSVYGSRKANAISVHGDQLIQSIEFLSSDIPLLHFTQSIPKPTISETSSSPPPITSTSSSAIPVIQITQSPAAVASSPAPIRSNLSPTVQLAEPPKSPINLFSRPARHSALVLFLGSALATLIPESIPLHVVIESPSSPVHPEFDIEVPPTATLRETRELITLRGNLKEDWSDFSFKLQGTDYFIQESAHQSLWRLPVISYFLKKDIVPRLALAPKGDLERQRKIDFKISKILNIPPTDWRVGDNDATECRIRLSRVLKTADNIFTTYASATYAESTSDPLPLDFPTSFRITVDLRGLGESVAHIPTKVLPVGSHQTSIQLLEVLSDKMNRLGSPLPLPPSELIMKISGSAQYISHLQLLSRLRFVRKALKRRDNIMISLVPISTLPTIDEVKELSFVDQIDQTSSEFDRGSNLHGDQVSMSSIELKKPFEVQIVRMAGFKEDFDRYFYVEIALYHSGALLCPPLITSLKKMTRALSKGDESAALFRDWLRTGIKISQIPLEARICISVYSRSTTTSRAAQHTSSPTSASGQPSSTGSTLHLGSMAETRFDDESSSDEDDRSADLAQSSQFAVSTSSMKPMGFSHQNATALGNVNCLIFDFTGQLVSGEITLKLWPDQPANPIGTCIENLRNPSPATITLLFHSYPFPVFFPRLDALPSSRLASAPSPANVEEERKLMSIVHYDPLTHLSDADKALIWNHRIWLRDCSFVPPKSLVKVLQCVNWSDFAMVRESYWLIKTWTPLEPVDALELLDARFADKNVRAAAIRYLDALSNFDLRSYLLQLVQVVKYEPKHFSVLVCWLILRARASPIYVGHPLFWHLFSEMHVPEISERYTTMLEFFLRMCTDEERDSYASQIQAQSVLANVAAVIKNTPHSKRKQVLRQELARVERSINDFRLPIDPSRRVGALMIDSCKHMASAKAPLWLVFQNSDPVGDPILLMFKSGDDLRQDQLTLQMLNIMDNIWKAHGLDFRLSPYGCISTGDEMGYIEIVLNSKTVATIQKEAAGVAGAFKTTPISNWLKEHNPKPSDYDMAVENFMHSCAGYCVSTYVLGIGDRHNDNIMVNQNGLLFHIDFGHFLGNVKTFFGVKRERAPFILTPEFVNVMGGKTDPRFQVFIDMACRGYNLLRRSATLFINLFAMMLSTGIPELQSEDDIHYLRDAFSLDLTDAEAAAFFTQLINDSLNSKSTSFNFASHIFAQKYNLGI